MMPNRIDLTGMKFGRLTVLNMSNKRDNSGNVYWNVLCDCGIKKQMAGRVIRSVDKRKKDNHEVSCGCRQREVAREQQKKHLKGKRFGKLVVVARASVIKEQTYWRCLCDCGNEKIIRQLSLILGSTKSCGCLNHETTKRRKDLSGKRFGRLTVIGFSHTATFQRASGKKSQEAVWKCRCDCGNSATCISRVLIHGLTKSCGCMSKSANGLSVTKGYKSSKERVRKLSIGQRTPAWSDETKISEFYNNRPPNMHVDHVLPLRGKLVSGLHVIENLQYLSQSDNCSKSNKYNV